MALGKMDYWRLSDEFSVVDAAILITGNDPSDKTPEGSGDLDIPTEWVQKTNHDGFEAVFKALKNAVLSNKLPASVAFPVGDGNHVGAREFSAVLRKGTKVFQSRELSFWRHDALVFLQVEPDWTRTLIELPNLRAWLRGRDVFPEFFFPKGDPQSFMNKEHPRFSGKLACAVAAWKAVLIPAKNKTPKQTVEAWVIANGVQYGLANGEGTVPQTAVDEIAKVVNWQPQGGAARTGGQVPETSPEDELGEAQNYDGLDVVEAEDGYGVKVDAIPF